MGEFGDRSSFHSNLAAAAAYVDVRKKAMFIHRTTTVKVVPTERNQLLSCFIPVIATCNTVPCYAMVVASYYSIAFVSI
jgi:uncharacterized NAD(P)/FAD-binding protein YdhS